MDFWPEILNQPSNHLMASYHWSHPLIADGNCEWGSQCSCSLNDRWHSYSIDLHRRTVSSVEMKIRFLKEIEDDATSTLVEKEDHDSKKSLIDSKKSSRRICKKNDCFF